MMVEITPQRCMHSQNRHQSDFFREMFPGKDAEGNKVEMTCPLCGRVLILRTSQTGHMFYGCSNYRSRECKFTRNYGPVTSKQDHT